MSRRAYVRHQPIADRLRETPEDWAKVDNYVWRESAKHAVKCIRDGRLGAYQPAGSFEAEIRVGSDGDALVFARYVGPSMPH